MMENHLSAITLGHRLGCSTPTGTGVLFEDKLALHEGSAGTGGALAADFPEDASPAADAQSHKHHVSFQEPSGPDSQGSDDAGDDAGDAQTGADQAERGQAALDSVLNPQTAQWERYPEVPSQDLHSSTNTALLGAAQGAGGFVFGTATCKPHDLQRLCLILQRGASGAVRTASGVSSGSDGSGSKYLVMPQPVLVPRLGSTDEEGCVLSG
jgi:hypothetical protein